MAFPIPSHLPRRTAVPQDVSSAILSKLDAATSKTLNASLAASWLQELDQNISDTKKHIHDRIHEDLPLFERQEASANSVQTRLQSLTTDVDDLVNKLSRPQTGLVPVLLDTLTKHAALKQESADAAVLHDCLDHLARFRTELTQLDSLIRDGKLPQAVAAYHAMDSSLEEHPRPLVHSAIMADLKTKFRATRARAEDQLSDAYNRSIVVSPDVLQMLPAIKVRQSQTVISFSDILAALSPDALLNHLNILRRDLMSLYVVRLLDHHSTLTLSTREEHRIFCSPGSPDRDALDSVATVLTFLSAHLFSALPSPQDVEFPLSLRKPLAQNVLNHLLVPLLPSSFEPLPQYLDLVNKAVKFEAECIQDTLGAARGEGMIETWANGVDGHYERQRRLLILDSARALVVSPPSRFDNFAVEVELQVEKEQPTVVPVQDDAREEEEDAWGFAEGSSDSVDETNEQDGEADGWGFDDDAIDTDPTSEESGSAGTDPTDAWEWNDDDSLPVDDDPWADPPPEDEPPIAITSPPKAANGLVKKDKKHVNGNSPSTSSPSIASPSVPQKPPEKEKRPAMLAPPAPARATESYMVSSQMKEILKMMQDVLNEGEQLSQSHVFQTRTSPGALLVQTAPTILDLYRAMYPVVFASEMKSKADWPMRFSNNCLYLSSQLAETEPQRRLKVLGESWYHDTIEHQRQAVDKRISDGAVGFTFTGEQDRYDDCEAALVGAVGDIKATAAKWRGVLTKSKYYTAIGAIVEAALTRVLDDITALPDIPELDSKRLSELCRILHSLEALFVEGDATLGDRPSFVVAYVPSWLKFSYLSELLEASMADIKYLFEEGALVDFEIEELVRLVRALFADTALRAETINKLMGGHGGEQY